MRSTPAEPVRGRPLHVDLPNPWNRRFLFHPKGTEMRFNGLGFTNDNHALIQPILVHCGAGTSATDRSILSRRRLARADVEVAEAKPEPGQIVRVFAAG
jgi:hypothetical protein